MKLPYLITAIAGFFIAATGVCEPDGDQDYGQADTQAETHSLGPLLGRKSLR